MIEVVREMGMLKMGRLGSAERSLADRGQTKRRSRRSMRMRVGTATFLRACGKLEEQLKLEVEGLLAKAEAADKADVHDGMSIPEELAWREQCLKKLAEARTKIEARAKQRYERKTAEYEDKLAKR